MRPFAVFSERVGAKKFEVSMLTCAWRHLDHLPNDKLGQSRLSDLRPELWAMANHDGDEAEESETPGKLALPSLEEAVNAEFEESVQMVREVEDFETARNSVKAETDFAKQLQLNRRP